MNGNRVLSRRDFLREAALGTSALLSSGDRHMSLVAQSPATQVFYDPATLNHEPGAGHPERPQRMTAVLESVRALEKLGRVAVATPRPATEDEILAVHNAKIAQSLAVARRKRTVDDPLHRFGGIKPGNQPEPALQPFEIAFIG